MKKIFAMTLLATLPLAAMAQYEEGSENGVVSLAGREGFSIQTKKADFVFKPYLLVQTAAHINWYDDEGLDKAYNQDNLANSGFAVPYAVLGLREKRGARYRLTSLSMQQPVAEPILQPGMDRRGPEMKLLPYVSVNSRLPSLTVT